VLPWLPRHIRTYVFDKKLPQPSELVLVRLPRPMGVVFEWDQRRKRAFVVDVVEGSVAEQQRRKAKLNAALLKESVQDGECACVWRRMVCMWPAPEWCAGGLRQSWWRLALSSPHARTQVTSCAP
jgi:hypothetical protein